jgi:outer membrane biogenesis lipoprotein LolB
VHEIEIFQPMGLPRYPEQATITIKASNIVRWVRGEKRDDVRFTLVWDSHLEDVFKDIAQGHWRVKYEELKTKLGALAVEK